MSEASEGARARQRPGLVQRRKAAGMTQEQLAERLGIDPTTVGRWERGETRPQPWLWPKLAGILGVAPGQVETLLAATEPGEPTANRPGSGTPSDLPAEAGLAGTGSVSPGGAMLVIPRQLPAEVTGFTGRVTELETLTQLLDEAAAMAETPGTVVISAIGGTAGIGKTTLALHWAHRVAGRFGDGQLHVNLRGFDPGGVPLPPETAIRGFLDTLGVPPERVPLQAEAQAGLYRSLLADRKMLIVLDNARDEQQVRPLLPAGPGSLVLVTSRSQLSGLAAADGARLLTLDALSHEEAIQMLTNRIGASRARAEPDAVDEIAAACAHLPLALAVAAARASTRPRFSLGMLAAELRDAHGRLDALDSGDPAASVRAVFSWSYRQLHADTARMFRFLGLHPGPDISVPAAASLAATTVTDARRLLRELTRAHLIDEHASGRYAFHDLLRVYAADAASDLDSETDRHEATSRALDHYLHTASTAARLLEPGQDHIVLAAPRPGATPEVFPSHWQALAWFEAEYRVVLAAVALAGSSGSAVHTWQLPAVMSRFLNSHGYHQEAASIQHTALAAATHLGDIAAQAVCRRLLAAVCMGLGDYEQALRHYDSSRDLYQRLGDRHGEARIHQELGIMAQRQGRCADSVRHAEQALRLYRAAGDKVREAVALNNAGFACALLGDYQQARAYCQSALVLNADAGNRKLDGYTWDSLGYVELRLGNLDEAAACYERALGIAREVSDRWLEAQILAKDGETRQASGDSPRARLAWQQALEIFEDLQDPGAAEVRAKLDGLAR